MKKLFGEYSYKIVDYKTIQPIFSSQRDHVFGKEFTIELEKYFSKEEQAFLKSIPKSEIYRLHILIYKNEDLIGWHIGFQKYTDYYMMNTAVFKEHQGKGIYTKLLQEIIQIVKEKGFHTISSRHILSNNQVIVPKLKVGFCISGMEIEERFGTLVNLKYFFNEEIKKVYLMRSGATKPSKKMLE